jgi:hypothetical protein
VLWQASSQPRANWQNSVLKPLPSKKKKNNIVIKAHNAP